MYIVKVSLYQMNQILQQDWPLGDHERFFLAASSYLGCQFRKLPCGFDFYSWGDWIWWNRKSTQKWSRSWNQFNVLGWHEGSLKDHLEHAWFCWTDTLLDFRCRVKLVKNELILQLVASTCPVHKCLAMAVGYTAVKGLISGECTFSHQIQFASICFLQKLNAILLYTSLKNRLASPRITWRDTPCTNTQRATIINPSQLFHFHKEVTSDH